jgi:hypothetical protein
MVLEDACGHCVVAVGFPQGVTWVHEVLFATVGKGKRRAAAEAR